MITCSFMQPSLLSPTLFLSFHRFPDSRLNPHVNHSFRLFIKQSTLPELAGVTLLGFPLHGAHKSPSKSKAHPCAEDSSLQSGPTASSFVLPQTVTFLRLSGRPLPTPASEQWEPRFSRLRVPVALQGRPPAHPHGHCPPPRHPPPGASSFSVALPPAKLWEQDTGCAPSSHDTGPSTPAVTRALG